MKPQLIVNKSKPLLGALLCLLLAACVPTLQRFYQAPMVLGRVLDLNTLKPMAGVQVSHWEYSQTSTSTDVDGTFTLASVSAFKATILMPGHALKKYPVKLTSATSSTLVMATATLLMRREELVPVDDIVIDTQPHIIAAAPKPGQNEHAQLLAVIDKQAKLGQCDRAIGMMAVNSLGLARKLTQRWQTTPAPSQLPALTSVSYGRVNQLWRFWEASCSWEGLSNMQRYAEIITVRELIKELDSESPIDS